MLNNQFTAYVEYGYDYYQTVILHKCPILRYILKIVQWVMVKIWVFTGCSAT